VLGGRSKDQLARAVLDHQGGPVDTGAGSDEKDTLIGVGCIKVTNLRKFFSSQVRGMA
jgi:hypothetical protein